MMIQKLKRIIYNLNEISIRCILLFSGLVFPLIFHGHSSADNYAPDITNPFHDVFYNYYNYESDKAKKLLKKLFNNRHLRNQAYINYGLIQEFEGNYSEAERYYREALKNDDRTSLIYLYNLYRKEDRDKTMPLLSAIEIHMQSFWIDYEKAAYYIEKDDKDRALECLSQAIDKGFSSTDLLLNDTAFDSLRKSSAFRRLIKKAEKNFSSSDSITERMKQTEYEYKSDKPYGKISELDMAAYFEKTGKEKKALSILSSIIKSRIPFRDKSIALFWLARINAKNGNEMAARKYIQDFIDHITAQESDITGYKDLVSPIYKDIILNDRFLCNIAGDMIK